MCAVVCFRLGGDAELPTRRTKSGKYNRGGSHEHLQTLSVSKPLPGLRKLKKDGAFNEALVLGDVISKIKGTPAFADEPSESERRSNATFKDYW